MKKFVLKTMVSSLIIAGVSIIATFARGWTTDGSDWFYYDGDNQLEKETIKGSGDERYYLDENGFMVRDYLLEDYNGQVYYFDESGKMVMNTWVAVDTTQVQNAMDNAPSIYLYYFGTNGRAYKSSGTKPVKKTIDGKRYLFNENGQMLSGWINEEGERFNFMDTDDDPFVGYCYYAGDETDGVLREGWSAYEDGSVDDKYYTKQVLWFYFKPDNCKKECSDESDKYKTRVINGKKYGFDVNGVMIQGWESDTVENYGDTRTYFSEKEGEELGRMHKKEWIFAVPSKEQCETDATDAGGGYKDASNDHDEEIQRWFYALGSGDIVKNAMRRIDGNYYTFNKVGVMKSGLCILNKNDNTFIDCIDTEKTDGKDFILSRKYISMESYTSSDEFRSFDDKTQKILYFVSDEESKEYGKRKLGDVTVSFADNDYTFGSTNVGENEQLKKKKYYQAGILLKAESSLGLGLVFLGYSSSSNAVSVDTKPQYNYTEANRSTYAIEDVNHPGQWTDYIVDDSMAGCAATGAYPVYAVVDANGNKVDKSHRAVKDKAGHYWLLGGNGSLVKIFDVPLKYDKVKKIWFFRSEVEDAKHKVKTDWIAFQDSPGYAYYNAHVASLSTVDAYGKQCFLDRALPVGGDLTKTYETYIDDAYATNFRFKDR